MVQPAVQRAAVQPAVQRAAVQLLAWRAWSNNDNAYITYTTYMRRRTWKCQNLALDVHPHPQTSSADSDIPKFPDINLALNPCIHHKTYMIQQQPSVSQSVNQSVLPAQCKTICFLVFGMIHFVVLSNLSVCLSLINSLQF